MRRAKKEESGVDFFKDKPESAEDSHLASWYADIGKKIKEWAKWIFILEAIAAVIGALVMLVTAEDWVVSFAALLFVSRKGRQHVDFPCVHLYLTPSPKVAMVFAAVYTFFGIPMGFYRCVF